MKMVTFAQMSEESLCGEKSADHRQNEPFKLNPPAESSHNVDTFPISALGTGAPGTSLSNLC
jgi:hypothetical protein